MFTRDAYKFYIAIYVRSCCRINTLFNEYRETSGAALSLVPTTLVRILTKDL